MPKDIFSTVADEQDKNVDTTRGGAQVFASQDDEIGYGDSPTGRVLTSVSNTVTDYSQKIAALNLAIRQDDITTKVFDQGVTDLREKTTKPVTEQLTQVFDTLYNELEETRDSVRNTPQFDIDVPPAVSSKMQMLANSGNISLINQKFDGASDTERLALYELFEIVPVPDRIETRKEHRVLRDKMASFARQHSSEKFDAKLAKMDSVSNELENTWSLLTHAAMTLRAKTGLTDGLLGSSNQPLDKLQGLIQRPNPLSWPNAIRDEQGNYHYDYGAVKSTPGVLGGGSVPETTSIPADI